MNFERINTGIWRSEDKRWTVWKDDLKPETPWSLRDNLRDRTIAWYEQRSDAFKAAENLAQVLR